MKFYDKLFPQAVQLYSYLRDIAFAEEDLSIAKSVTFKLHDSDTLSIECTGNSGVFCFIQLNPKLLEPYLKILKSNGFISSYLFVKNTTFRVVLWKNPKLKAA